MEPTAWIFSIQFAFWSPHLHQHLRLHSTCHLNNKTYPLTPEGRKTDVCVCVCVSMNWWDQRRYHYAKPLSVCCAWQSNDMMVHCIVCCTFNPHQSWWRDDRLLAIRTGIAVSLVSVCLSAVGLIHSIPRESRQRDNIAISLVCMCVCVCVCLSLCLSVSLCVSGRFSARQS